MIGRATVQDLRLLLLKRDGLATDLGVGEEEAEPLVSEQQKYRSLKDDTKCPLTIM